MNETRNTFYPALAALILAAIPFLIYGNSLDSPFVADDLDYIQRDPAVSGFSLPGSLLELRPLNKFSYWLNLQIHGWDLPGYHLVNIGLHSLVAILLFFLFRRLLEGFVPGQARTGNGPVESAIPWEPGLRLTPAWLAFSGALLFAVHPLHTQAVNYTFARSELLSAVFVLAALLVHARKNGAAYGYGRGVTVSLFFLLAIAAKERAFMFIPCLVLFDLLVRRGDRKSVRNARWLKLAIPLSVVTLLGLVNFYVGFKSQHQGAIGQGGDVPPFVPYFLTEMGVRLHYLKLIFWPADLAFDHDFTLRRSLADPVLLAAMAGNLALLAGAFFLRRWDGRVAFGIFWFFLFILPTSGVAPAALLMHEHWTYLPCFGLFLALLALIQHGLAWAENRNMSRAEGRKMPRTAGWTAVACLLLLSLPLAYRTYGRNQVWQRPVSLWLEASKTAPGKARVWNNLGANLLEKKKYAQALTALHRAEDLAEPTSASRYNIGLCYLETGSLQKAEQYLKKAAQMSPNRAEIQLALGKLYQMKGKLRRSVDNYVAAMEQGFFSPEVVLNLAEVYLRMDTPWKAKKLLQEGLRIFPGNRKIEEAEKQITKEKP